MPNQPQIPWDYYASLRRQQAAAPASSDPVAATLSAMNADTAHQAVLTSGDPAQIGRANQLGRQVGEHPAMIEDGLDDVQRGINAQGMAGMAQANPAIGQHLAQNPRTAAAAAGDHQWLNVLGQSWDHLTNTLPGVIDDIFQGTNNSGANGGTSSMGASGLIARPLMAGMAALMGNTAAAPALKREAGPVGQNLRGALFAGVANLYSGATGYARMVTDGIGWGSASQLLDQQRRNANDYAMRTMPHTGEWVPDQILGGVSNVPSTGLALGVGLGGRAVGLGLKSASALGAISGGVVQGGQSYNKARDEGLSWGQAAAYANIDAATETAGEYVGELQFLKATAGGSSLMTRFLRSQIGEVAGEEFSTVAQDFSAWAILPENKNKPISDFFEKLPEDMASTAVQTLVAGGISNLTIGGIEHVLNTGAAQLRRRVAAEGPDIVRADMAQPVIETMAQAAQNSQLRARDPEGYNDIVRDLGEQHGATHVFVPGEAVQSYLQSDGFDPFTDPMSQWADHAREAAATGGDVVLPVEFALGTLPGTPAFAALKDDMRLDAGGLSQREADELKARYPKAMETMAERATGADQGQQASNAAIQRIVDRVTAQLEQNGFTPAAASAQAQLIAMREATRAARLGRDLTGNEFQTEVRQIGTPPAPEARQADVNDLVIHALRKGAPATTQGGKSLLEFIADRGGINDDGGDLRSMGIEDWHRAKPFRNRLVRDPELGLNTGAPSGRGDYGIDSTLRAAIEAGYFPELANVENEHGPSTLDTNHLMDAIGEELAGSPRYAEAPTTDHIRQWAEDLRQMLESQGHDPASMTDEQIREAIGKLEPGSDSGLNYEELPEGAARALEQGETLAEIQADAASRGVTLKITDGRYGTEINLIDTSEAGRGTGVGTEFMQRLANWADANGARLLLTPDTSFGASSRSRLVSFYKRFGFKENKGRSRDYSTMAGMIRDPKGYNQGAFSGPRGRILFGGQHPVIELFQARNLSTLLHELGHQWLEELRADAEGADTVRLYRGQGDLSSSRQGNTKDGHLNFTTDPEIAANYAGRNPDGELYYIDLPRQEAEKYLTGHLADVPEGVAQGMKQFTDYASLRRAAMDQGFALTPTEYHEHAVASAAQLPAIASGVVQDWETVKRWFADKGHAIGEDGVIPVDAHELWARGTERYLMEGRAPSSALSRLFETFRGWMLAIYRKVDSLRAPITPEIRQVMDRMLATDDEITAAQDRLQLEPLFRDAASAGMTGPEFAAYADQVQRAREEAGGQLMAKTMADIRRSKQAAYQREWREERDKQAEQLDRSPLLSAIRLAKENGISKSWMADRLGQDAVDLLPRMVPPLAREKGMNADDLAEQAGFASGQQMIETLIGAERAHKEVVAGGDKRGLRQRLIDTATDAAMEARHGTDPFNNGEIEREAQAAVNNQLQGEVLAAEARALARRTGQDVTPYSLARQWARNKVRGGIVAEEASAGAIARHARNVAKAGRAAEAALVKGDMGAALVAKQQQLISSALLAEAKEAHDQVEAAKDRLAKIARRKTMKSVDQAYLEQAQTLLAEVNFVEATQKLLDRQNKWAEWAQARQAEGYDVVVPASFEATIKGTHWTRLSVENLMGLDEAVAQVMHLGRLKQSLLDGQEERDWADIEAEAVHAASHLRQRPPAPLIEPGLGDRIKSGILSIDAALLRMETVFDWLDGGDPNGVFNRIAFRPVADAQAREDAMLADYYHRTRNLFEAVPREDLGRWQDKVVLPFQYRVTGAPVELRRHQIIAMALNVGNEGNLQRLADGYGWNRGAIMDFLNGTLTKGEWTYVQGVWDTIETLWPQIEAMEKRINGVAPDKVEPLKFLTPHGEMQGGYYPAIYDETRDYKAEENRGRDADLFEGRYTRANTTASATKAREEVVKKPILLDMGVINRHLGEVIHDITHREAVMKAWRFLTSERVMQAVDEALGPEVRKQFRPWVKFIANRWASERAGNEGFGKFIQALRANTTAVGLGLRASTILVHTSGLVYGTEVIGEKWMAQGMAAMAKDYRGTVNHVLEQSPEVRAHLEHFDNDIRKQIDKLNDGRPLTKAAAHIREAQRFLFHGIGFMVQRVSVPVWVGAYNKGISEGLSDADAKFAADKAVRKTMGSAGAKDLAAIQRGTGKWGEVAKLFTMFYTQMSAQYQRQRTLYRDATGQDVRQPRSLGRLAARAWWLIAIAPMWDAAIKMALGGHGPDDDEWWATFVFKHALANQLAPIPGLRDLFQPTWNAVAGHKVFNPSVTPLQKVYDSVINLGKDVGNVAHGKPTKQLTRHALESVGYATGLVPGQFASATQFLVDLGNGEAHPHSVSDWVQGLSTGKIKEH
ncbi:N-acetyltransferase [Novosphingobium rosa]|uniref:N-acetyltransferase n=1 Tax=Novosphingobium rosa TaxID=76978 RepID=UPI0008370351|nr:N-acetyltransferase [Novosphingobium rosa]